MRVDAHAGGQKAFDQRFFKRGRMRASVITDHHLPSGTLFRLALRSTQPLAASADHRGTECAAERIGVLLGQRFADNAADIVLANDSGIEDVGHDRRKLTVGLFVLKR